MTFSAGETALLSSMKSQRCESSSSPIGVIHQQYPSAPSRSDAWLSILAYQLGRRSGGEAELAVFRFIAEEFPGSDGAWLDLARAYEGRGELERSREASAKALEVNPRNTDAAELLERLEKTREPG